MTFSEGHAVVTIASVPDYIDRYRRRSTSMDFDVEDQEARS